MCGRFNEKRVPWPVKMALAVTVIPGFLFLGTFAAWLLWNALMPVIFQLPELSYWQTMGILVLGKLIFGGFGGHGRSSRVPRKPLYKDRDEWKEHVREKFREGISENRYHSSPRGTHTQSETSSSDADTD